MLNGDYTYLIYWNILVFLIYGYDKWQAKRGDWRVPEKTLMLLALFMGGPGAWFGMQIWRHKTKHKLFTIGVPLCIVINIAVFWFFEGKLPWILQHIPGSFFQSLS